MDKGKQAPVTVEEIRDCEAFKQLRIRYHMTQKEWAKAIHISYGLVKGIEAHRIKCSANTKKNIHSFEVNYNSSDLQGLEARIIYDVLLSHMEQTIDRTADIYQCSARCTKAIQNILAHIAEFENADTQNTYLLFLTQILTTLDLAINDAATSILQGENVLDNNQGLKSIFNGKQVTKFKNSGRGPYSNNGKATWQENLFGL